MQAAPAAPAAAASPPLKEKASASPPPPPSPPALFFYRYMHDAVRAELVALTASVAAAEAGSDAGAALADVGRRARTLARVHAYHSAVEDEVGRGGGLAAAAARGAARRRWHPRPNASLPLHSTSTPRSPRAWPT